MNHRSYMWQSPTCPKYPVIEGNLLQNYLGEVLYHRKQLAAGCFWPLHNVGASPRRSSQCYRSNVLEKTTHASVAQNQQGKPFSSCDFSPVLFTDKVSVTAGKTKILKGSIYISQSRQQEWIWSGELINWKLSYPSLYIRYVKANSLPLILIHWAMTKHSYKQKTTHHQEIWTLNWI